MFCVTPNFWESQEGSFSYMPHQFLFLLHLLSSAWRSHQELQTASKVLLRNLVVAKHHAWCLLHRKWKKNTYCVCFWPNFDVIGISRLSLLWKHFSDYLRSTYPECSACYRSFNRIFLLKDLSSALCEKNAVIFQVE